ncbi:hypothetical protein AABB24_026026, partial [Solanum stoloniferum]
VNWLSLWPISTLQFPAIHRQYQTTPLPIRDFFSFTRQNRQKVAIVLIDGTTGADLQLRLQQPRFTSLTRVDGCHVEHKDDWNEPSHPPCLSSGFQGIWVEFLYKRAALWLLEDLELRIEFENFDSTLILT